jgi:hypothetical protein
MRASVRFPSCEVRPRSRLRSPARFAGVERTKIVDAFADADRVDRETVALLQPATRTPPRAVPSSFVITRPVTPATSLNTSIWLSAFCPVVASSTSTDVVRRLGFSGRGTRLILASSSISPFLFWSRPPCRRSARRSLSVAFFTPSNTIAELSPPSGPVMIGTPIRSAQILSCSIAAARNVSPAARSTP